MTDLVLADGCMPRRSLTTATTIFRPKHNLSLSGLSVLAEKDTNSRSIDSKTHAGRAVGDGNMIVTHGKESRS